MHPSVSANSVAELVKLAKAQPGMLRYASAGVGTLPHIEGELLKARAGIDISHVPYRGGGPGLIGLLGGRFIFSFRLSPSCCRMSAMAACGDWL